ncbi:hypothetical protein Pfo_025747 [Paulownia fortunei]|nr:hypothetical protein Pfo_025747 [Paulownia fortunei]
MLEIIVYIEVYACTRIELNENHSSKILQFSYLVVGHKSIGNFYFVCFYVFRLFDYVLVPFSAFSNFEVWGRKLLFKEEKNDKEGKKRLLSLDIMRFLKEQRRLKTNGSLLTCFTDACGGQFCSAEDDGHFWRQMIKPEAVAQADFGNDNQISLIAAEVGGTVEAAPTEAQIELFDALIDGFREAVKGETLDPKADEVLRRVEELQLLAKRISRYDDPISQFRALAYLKPSMWSKVFCLEVELVAQLVPFSTIRGFSNWEKIRLDEKLCLTKKIAPVEFQHHETFLPRALQLKERASQLLEVVG